MSEAGTLSPIHQLGASILLRLFSLVRNLQVHEEGNDLIRKLVEDLIRSSADFREAIGEPFRLQIVAEDFFICGRLLRLDTAAFERAEQLGELLSRIEVGLIRLGPDTSEADLRALASDLSESLVRSERRVRYGDYGDISVAPLQGSAAAAFAFHPERLAVWLHATLLDLVDELGEARKEGRQLSLVPVKRVLQRMVDVMGSHTGLFQLLPCIRDFSLPLPPDRRAVSEAMHALGFGSALGLGRSELMSLGLASLLARLGEREGAQPLAELVDSWGLGELGSSVFLAVHGGLVGDESGPLPGQVLRLVRAYEDLLEAPGGLSPSAALDRLASEPPQGVLRELASELKRWKGSHPLGSPLRLDDSRLAIVIGWSDSGRARGLPRVLPVDGDRLGQALDLAEPGSPLPTEQPSPAQLGLDLSRLQPHEVDGLEA